MFDRMQVFTKEELSKIHNVTMREMEEIGVYFNDDNAVEIFKSRGFRTEGNKVFFKEKQVMDYVSKAPKSFKIEARNPEHNVEIGEKSFVCGPGYGAPFIMEIDGTRRNATLEDYNNFCKIIQSSEYIDINGFMMVEPHDIPPRTSHLDMLFSNITLSDKVFMGSPVSEIGAMDAIKMAEVVWGNVKERPVMVFLINSLSPLKYAKEMTESLKVAARYGQPVIVAPLMMGGASGPIKLAGLIALQNAEILAGIVLAQLIREGTPVIYGSASSITDMKTGGLSVGAPEMSKLISAVVQIADFYGIPSRAGGAITDTHAHDMQAGVESALALYTAIRSGVNFILHSAGIMNSYLAMSFEKFLVDEEICGMIKNVVNPIEVSDETLSFEIVKEIGIGGEFLSHPETLKLCRSEYFSPSLFIRDNYESWIAKGKPRIEEIAKEKLAERLNKYKKPDIDPRIEKDLKKFLDKRKSEYGLK